MTAPRTSASHTITLLPSDGIGPDVVAAARDVLQTVADRFGHHFAFSEALIGGAAIDATGNPLPAATLALCTSADAVLLGAVGGPKWDSLTAAVRPEQGLFALRQALGVFANLRPVISHVVPASSPFRPEHLHDVDLLVVRELTGGIYFGTKTCVRTADGETATDECRYTTVEIERIARVAGNAARARRKRVTSVDKANVLETSRLWRRVTTRIFAEEFPDVALDHLLVDTCAMRLVMYPRDFDVIVTDNMFGDILTDEAAVLAGSIGLLPSASLGAPAADGSRRGLYEPIHGSAPDIAGLGVANPIGAILSAALMLRYSFGLEREAYAIESAVRRTIADGVVTRDIAERANMASSTSAVAQQVAKYVA